MSASSVDLSQGLPEIVCRDADSCGSWWPPAFLPASGLARAVVVRLSGTAKHLNSGLRKRQEPALGEGGRFVVVQTAGLSNQGRTVLVSELCGPVPRAARDCLPGCGEWRELVTAGGQALARCGSWWSHVT